MPNLRTFSETLNTSQRAGLLAAVMVLIAGIILSALAYSEVRSYAHQQLSSENTRQLQHLGALLTPALVRDDRITLNLTLSEWDAGNALPAIRVLDRDGKPVASAGRINAELTMMPVEIRQDGTLYGSLEGYTTDAPAQTAATRVASQSLLVTAALSLIAGLTGWLLSEKYARYLRQLRTKLSGWRDGEELTLPMGPGDPDLQSLHSVLGDISKREQQRRAVEVALGQFMGNEETPFPDPMKYYDCAMLFIEIQDLELLQQ
ncbi:MAG: hypothetical protein C9355_02215, partial [Thalassolituus maritimus]